MSDSAPVRRHSRAECWCGVDHELERRIEEARVEYEKADGISSESAVTAYRLGKLDGLQLAQAIREGVARVHT